MHQASAAAFDSFASVGGRSRRKGRPAPLIHTSLAPLEGGGRQPGKGRRQAGERKRPSIGKAGGSEASAARLSCARTRAKPTCVRSPPPEWPSAVHRPPCRSARACASGQGNADAERAPRKEPRTERWTKLALLTGGRRRRERKLKTIAKEEASASPSPKSLRYN